ncbi:plakophilin-1 [Fundulus heteroclitus]|uniref:plakophilin-1 n=1 Tax=Fundulus heteroclitus TaxID=8078 RepID=UPI00165A8AF3|nr:plakophilin-1 [Fundulus heteroclitus]
MMAPDPTRFTSNVGGTVGGTEDTSLEVPSDRDLSSGKQRVLNQVHSIKRSKSKYKSGTTSPTSPVQETSKTFNDFGTSKYKASTYKRSISAGSAGFNRTGTVQMSRNLTTKSIRQIKSPNGLKPSSSDPAMVPDLPLAPSMKVKGQAGESQNGFQNQISGYYRSVKVGKSVTESSTQIVPSPPVISPSNGKTGSFIYPTMEQKSELNSMVNIGDLDLETAVEYLRRTNESYHQCGANFIQHICYTEDPPKDRVRELGGIPHLVNMLESLQQGPAQAASGALRNLIYRNKENKILVQKYGGIAKALNLMKRTKSTETKKQVTGLLWNLSSEDEVKPELLKTALPFLTKNVVLPYGSHEADVDPSVFHYSLGCLRNLSSHGMSGRQEMRNRTGLVQSLVEYLKSCVEEDNTDDKSVEHCVCILHNLSYQIWKERPETLDGFEHLRKEKSEIKESPTPGCFSPRSRKAQKESYTSCPRFDEDMALSKMKGLDKLFDLTAIDTYVALLKTSKDEKTVASSCGVLQNLTASGEEGAKVVSEQVFSKLNDNSTLRVLALSKSPATQKNILALVDNMSRKSSLHFKTAQAALPVLKEMTMSETWMDAPPKNVAIGCNTMHRLLLVDYDLSKKCLDKALIFKLMEKDMKENENDEGTIAVRKLLYNLWTDPFLSSVSKKLKIDKIRYINERTIRAHHELTPSLSGD